jgi:hypothetical protein
MDRFFGKQFLLTATLSLFFTSNPGHSGDTSKYRHWIQEMKTSSRGPFTEGIKWYCNDGSIHPPKAYACSKHGGGVEHGAMGKKVRTLRDNGYWIANLLAGTDAKKLLSSPDFIDRYNQLLIEKYLVAADDGWILRKALFYRGAIQEEDEREAARQLLIEMAGRKEWIQTRFAGLRTGVHLLPHGKDMASVQKVRQMAASLAEQDKQFHDLRVKIHGSPDAGDAQRVRKYAKTQSHPEKYLALAQEIDEVYKAIPLPELLRKDARIFSGAHWLQKLLTKAAHTYESNPYPEHRYTATATLLADLRDALPRVHSHSARLRVMDLSLAVEAENFRQGTVLRKAMHNATRQHRINWIKQSATAAYGIGLINKRSLQEVRKSISRLSMNDIPLNTYIKELNYLGRIPGWGTQTLRYQFFESVQKLAEIEPLALHFIPAQLRSSPLLLLSQILDGLARDANNLAGVKHKLFGEEIGTGFHALNPGLVRGVLHTSVDMEHLQKIRPDGIYVLPETVSDLPPLAGIITAGEGNPLSHVQLLARNLGIPNVTVDEPLLPKLQQHDGETIIMAVSPAGLVELDKDSERWHRFFTQKKNQGNVVIRPDLKKLDLSVRRFIDLNELRASDSGRIVGPKAAKLGELKHHFPDKVADGVAIPFGIFREVVLDKPYKDTSQTVFDWMVKQYAHIHSLPEGSKKRAEYAEAFRAELYEIILHASLGQKFAQDLEQAILKTFGTTDLGVFVRSDTNVEDLAGFTGAGLNLTLPNVIGFEEVLKAINEVWASPFTARAFAWRQSHMQDPQHVYPAVLLLRSVSNEKSGVMVTEDIDTGDRHILSVAVNEGVGGAVDGQSAESLRINIQDGSVRVLATATAPWRRQPSPEGGIIKLPTSGSDTVLQPGEIRQLIAFAKQLPEIFPPITDDKGNPAPADIEFGFVDGKLHLFQLRPFLQNEKAQGSRYLQSMDEALAIHAKRHVNMKGVPGT